MTPIIPIAIALGVGAYLFTRRAAAQPSGGGGGGNTPPQPPPPQGPGLPPPPVPPVRAPMVLSALDSGKSIELYQNQLLQIVVPLPPDPSVIWYDEGGYPPRCGNTVPCPTNMGPNYPTSGPLLATGATMGLPGTAVFNYTPNPYTVGGPVDIILVPRTAQGQAYQTPFHITVTTKPA